MNTLSTTRVLQLEICSRSKGPAFDLFGVRFQTKAGGNAMNSRFCVAEMLFPDGANLPLHFHLDPEFFYVLAGACEFATIEDGSEKWVPGETGDSVLIPVGVPHGLRNESGADARLLVVTSHDHELFLQEAGTPASPAKSPCAVTDEELERAIKTAAYYGTYTLTPQRFRAGQTLAVSPTPRLIPRCYWRLERVICEDQIPFKLEK